MVKVISFLEDLLEEIRDKSIAVVGNAVFKKKHEKEIQEKLTHITWRK